MLSYSDSVLDLWHSGTDPRMRIWILWSVLLTGSGFCSFRRWLQNDNKTFSLSFLTYSFLKNIYIILQRSKVIKKSLNSRHQGFSSLFCLLMGGSGSGAVQINYGSGFGSGRPQKIRIQIQNIGFRCVALKSKIRAINCQWLDWAAVRKEHPISAKSSDLEQLYKEKLT